MAVAPPAFNDSFLRAARSQPTEHIPVWFMRQAGRSLPGYRKIRKSHDVLTIARTPELATQVSLEPVERLGVDAAILFADIMLLPIAMGIDVKIVENIGPVIDQPIAGSNDLARLAPFQEDHLGYLAETIKLLRGELNVPLIGFSAAPFTLASYLIEGQPTRTWTATKRFMLTQPKTWHELMAILTSAVTSYLKLQIAAGVQAVQLFDSWVGCLSPSHYHNFVLPYTSEIFANLHDQGVPRLHFGTDTSGLLADFASVDCEVIGLDWRIDLAAARSRISQTKALQGNFDPTIMLADAKTIQTELTNLLSSLPDRTGFIFNFGHGVLPGTDDSKLKALVEFIHAQPTHS